ncbi:hypothetical protein P9112_002861 [Eukaryota sp. TZLM1-RC]
MHDSTPHYNTKGEVTTLIGNWYEESCSKAPLFSTTPVDCTPTLLSSTTRSTFVSPNPPSTTVLKKHLEEKQLLLNAQQTQQHDNNQPPKHMSVDENISTHSSSNNPVSLNEPPLTRWTELRCSSSVYHSNCSSMLAWGKTTKFSTPINPLQ